MDHQCLKNSSVSFSVKTTHHILVVPSVTHDVHFNTKEAEFSKRATITIHVSKYDHVLSNCNLVLENVVKRVVVRAPSFNQLDISKDQREIGIRYILQAGQSTHYILRYLPGKRITWLEAERFCMETLEAQPLVYFSQTELQEIYRIFRGEPSVIFASFHNKKMVRICFFDNK